MGLPSAKAVQGLPAVQFLTHIHPAPVQTGRRLHLLSSSCHARDHPALQPHPVTAISIPCRADRDPHWDCRTQQQQLLHQLCHHSGHCHDPFSPDVPPHRRPRRPLQATGHLRWANPHAGCQPSKCACQRLAQPSISCSCTQSRQVMAAVLSAHATKPMCSSACCGPLLESCFELTDKEAWQSPGCACTAPEHNG